MVVPRTPKGRHAAIDRDGQSVPSQTAFTVASFNSRWGVDAAGSPFDMVAACRSLDADVILLQEVWRPDGEAGAAREVADALRMETVEEWLARGAVRGGPRIVEDEAGDGWWGLAVLSRFPVEVSRPIPLGKQARDPVTRAAMDVCVSVAGVRVRVVNVHLSFRPRSALRQLRLLRSHLDPASPTLVGGDMNLWAALARLQLRGWRAAVRGRTWPSSRPHSQLDQLLVTRDVEIVGGAVVHAGSSDHLPIRARLAVSADSARAPRSRSPRLARRAG